MTHGSHLVDTARFLGGELDSVQARFVERFGSYCWYVAVTYADGSLGHLDIIVPIQGDFEEGFQIFGERGSAKGRVYLPWFHKASDVECFSADDQQYHRPLGADAYTYKLQIEGFADTILNGAPMQGASLDDGTAAVRALRDRALGGTRAADPSCGRGRWGLGSLSRRRARRAPLLLC